jgi:glutamate racemase (EC 5.1.1.3)
MAMATGTSDAAPVGVFDSGLGGLSVLAELRALLPHRDFIYVADSGHCPYGDRSPDEIRARAQAITTFLIGQGAELVVVACNAATVTAIDALRAQYALPFVGMEPAIKPAAARTRSGVVGVLATTVTARGERLQRLVRDHASGVQVLTQPCPGLVERVEDGALHDPATEALLRRYLDPLLQAGADTVVLGCTHYPFLRPLIGASPARPCS